MNLRLRRSLFDLELEVCKYVRIIVCLVCFACRARSNFIYVTICLDQPTVNVVLQRDKKNRTYFKRNVYSYMLI